MEKRTFLVTELLAFFLGALGIHRFYTGYIGIGIVQLLTLGGCGIWSFIDLICISLNQYKDANNQDLDDYNKGVGYGIIAFIVIVFALNILAFVIS